MLRCLLFPHLCILCRQHNDSQLPLCQYCCESLLYLNPAELCQQCGAVLSGVPQALCGRCLQHPPHFDHCLPMLRYNEVSAYLITRLKFHSQLAIAKVLAQLWILHVQKIYQDTAYPTVIVPIPLHRSRLWRRGFNQTVVLANIVSQSLKIPVSLSMLHKAKATRAQSELNAQERLKNLKNTFTVKTSVPAHLVLLDDVVTTGTTVNEAARVLKAAGAHRVDVWCVARA